MASTCCTVDVCCVILALCFRVSWPKRKKDKSRISQSTHFKHEQQGRQRQTNNMSSLFSHWDDVVHIKRRQREEQRKTGAEGKKLEWEVKWRMRQVGSWRKSRWWDDEKHKDTWWRGLLLTKPACVYSLHMYGKPSIVGYYGNEHAGWRHLASISARRKPSKSSKVVSVIPKLIQRSSRGSDNRQSVYTTNSN